MNQPKGLKKIVVKEKNKPLHHTLSKSLIALFAVAQLSFGFNFGFQNVTGEKFRKLIYLMTISMACLMTFLLTLSFSLSGAEYFWMVAYFIQYIPTVFILISVKYSLCEFLTDLIAIDIGPLAEVKNDRIGPISWIYTSSMFVVKIATAIVYCLFTQCNTGRKLVVMIAIHIPLLGLDVIPVANFLLYYHVFARMRDLKIELERRDINLEHFQNIYKKVADNFEKFRISHDALFIWSFLTDSPKWIIMIWNHLILVKNSNCWLLLGCSYAWAFHVTVQICVPAVFAEMISVQTDAMKMILHEHLLIEKDETQALRMVRVLEYMEARPLLRKAWRLVPLDLQLPVTMLSMCTTYLIVIIQFTHLYD